ncbi:MAG TPA: hypothetical protein VKA65_04610 [Acidimicrobiales bacterium]|nr:hypothetical protein [Acidimicrobiales bacterium]
MSLLHKDHADRFRAEPAPGTQPGAGTPEGEPMARTIAHPTPAPALGGPVRVPWREGTLTRATELESLCDWVRGNDGSKPCDILVTGVSSHLEAARQAAVGQSLSPKRLFKFFRNASLLERAMSNLDAAEAQLLNFAPPDYVLGQMASLLRHVKSHLHPTDPRRQEFERICRRLGLNAPELAPLGDTDQADRARKLRIVGDERGSIVTAVRGASSAALREQLRVRSFRNALATASVLMAVLAVALALVGLFRPTMIPLCFAPEESGEAVVVCPTAQSAPFSTSPTDGASQAGLAAEDIDDSIEEAAKAQDIMVVELVGLTAAAVAGAAAIRGIRGSSERLGVPVALVLLKLPTGAITAFLGLLLMRGQFVPGLSALDTSAQILAWALVFGYAQQLFTRLVDRQGQTVLDSVKGADKPQASPSPP